MNKEMFDELLINSPNFMDCHIMDFNIENENSFFSSERKHDNSEI
jgi:hypothetical protein